MPSARVFDFHHFDEGEQERRVIVSTWDTWRTTRHYGDNPNWNTRRVSVSFSSPETGQFVAYLSYEDALQVAKQIHDAAVEEGR